MSIPTISPTTPTPDKQLEPLQDLKIKGFGSCQDTPSSKTASLPTPGGVPVPLANSADLMDASLGDNDDDEWPLIAPGAPLLKDLDSFTEGTGAGSFDSIPAAETDERGNPIYRLSEARLSLVSEPRDKDAYVLQWLRTLPTSHAQAPSTSLFSFYDLLESAPTLKRPRSMTEYDEYRPRRPRTRSCPSSRRSNSMAPD